MVPFGAKSSLISLVEQYRNALQVLNLRAADDDPSCTKAFDCSQEGEVLGIRFNTIDFTWSLPHGKLITLVTDLRKIANGDKVRYSLRDLERKMGETQPCLTALPTSQDLQF